jgi:GT2 family glycosyltransferase
MEVSGKLSLIVLMHNNISMSCDCLEALSASVADIDHEVIVVDNASTENIEPIRDRGSLFRSFRIITSSHNVPFSAINNHAAKETFGSWLLFLNNDVLVSPDTVKELLTELNRDDQVGVIGGRLLFPGGCKVQHAGIGQMLWGYPSNYGVGADPSDPRVLQLGQRFAVTGAMLCISRDAYLGVGGFDQRYIWGVEDIDICLKVRAAGLSVLYNPKAVAVHDESATLKVTQKWEPNHNYKVFREVWGNQLMSSERNYIKELKAEGIERVAVFGTGLAARGLCSILEGSGIEIVAFTSSTAKTKGEKFLNRPVVPLDSLRQESYDRILVASQFFFEVEQMLLDHDPARCPIYPIIQ